MTLIPTIIPYTSLPLALPAPTPKNAGGNEKSPTPSTKQDAPKVEVTSEYDIPFTLARMPARNRIPTESRTQFTGIMPGESVHHALVSLLERHHLLDPSSRGGLAFDAAIASHSRGPARDRLALKAHDVLLLENLMRDPVATRLRYAREAFAEAILLNAAQRGSDEKVADSAHFLYSTQKSTRGQEFGDLSNQAFDALFRLQAERGASVGRAAVEELLVRADKNSSFSQQRRFDFGERDFGFRSGARIDSVSLNGIESACEAIARRLVERFGKQEDNFEPITPPSPHILTQMTAAEFNRTIAEYRAAVESGNGRRIVSGSGALRIRDAIEIALPLAGFPDISLTVIRDGNSKSDWFLNLG